MTRKEIVDEIVYIENNLQSGEYDDYATQFDMEYRLSGLYEDLASVDTAQLVLDDPYPEADRLSDVKQATGVLSDKDMESLT
jgi:hypothetical protein